MRIPNPVALRGVGAGLVLAVVGLLHGAEARAIPPLVHTVAYISYGLGDASAQGDVAHSESDTTGTWDHPNGVHHSVFHTRAEATASYRALSAGGSLDFSNIWQSGSFVADGKAWFEDTLTINGGTPGTAGLVFIPVTLSGSYGLTLGTYDRVTFSFTFLNQNVTGGAGHTLGDTVELNRELLAAANFVFGTPFNISARLDVRAMSAAGYAELQTGHVFIDMTHTATLHGISEVHVGGVPFVGYTVTSASGTDYTAPLAVQPSSWGSLKALFR